MPRSKKVAQVEELAPLAPIVSREQYIKDIKIRWAIHTLEVARLGDDIKDGFNFIRPYVIQSVDYVCGKYNELRLLAGGVPVK